MKVEEGADTDRVDTQLGKPNQMYLNGPDLIPLLSLIAILTKHDSEDIISASLILPSCLIMCCLLLHRAKTGTGTMTSLVTLG